MPASFEYVGLKASQFKATAGGVFVIDPQRRDQVESQPRQQQQRFVGSERAARQMRPDRLLELAQPILELFRAGVRELEEFFRAPVAAALPVPPNDAAVPSPQVFCQRKEFG